MTLYELYYNILLNYSLAKNFLIFSLMGDFMIDLHIHTNYSDGTDNLLDILKKAEERKLEYI